MYLGVDLGTTNVKAVVVDDGGRIVAVGAAPVDRFCTPDGGVEQDIEQIWEATRSAIRQAVDGTGAGEHSGRRRVEPGRRHAVARSARQPAGTGHQLAGSAAGSPTTPQLTAELGSEFFARHIGHGGQRHHARPGSSSSAASARADSNRPTASASSAT